MYALFWYHWCRCDLRLARLDHFKPKPFQSVFERLPCNHVWGLCDGSFCPLVFLLHCVVCLWYNLSLPSKHDLVPTRFAGFVELEDPRVYFSKSAWNTSVNLMFAHARKCKGYINRFSGIYLSWRMSSMVRGIACAWWRSCPTKSGFISSLRRAVCLRVSTWLSVGLQRCIFFEVWWR